MKALNKPTETELDTAINKCSANIDKLRTHLKNAITKEEIEATKQRLELLSSNFRELNNKRNLITYTNNNDSINTSNSKGYTEQEKQELYELIDSVGHKQIELIH